MNRQPVLVFRTSVRSAEDVARLRPALEQILAREERWTFDLDDRDRVLRIEAAHTAPHAVMAIVQEHGHECVEME